MYRQMFSEMSIGNLIRSPHTLTNCTAVNFYTSLWVPSVKKFLWLKITLFHKILCIQIINECIPLWMLTLIYDSPLCSNILKVRLHNLKRSKAKLFYKVEAKIRNDGLYGEISVIIWYIRWADKFVDYQLAKKLWI